MRVNTTQKWPIKIWASILEPEAEKQLENLARLPFIHSHVAVMPDAHAGKGSTVGTVIATRGAIIPAAVGVDIGCGMAAVKLPFSLDRLSGDGQLSALRDDIEQSVPTGFNGNKEPCQRAKDYFDRKPPSFSAVSMPNDLLKKAGAQLGSLGGGNHFIEVCGDQDGGLWIVLHSGSRNIGKTLAERHIDKARGLMKDYFISLPDPDLAYLVQDSPEFDAYLHDLLWAQDYAAENRREMLARVMYCVATALGTEIVRLEREINCHHNYTSLENHYGKNVYVTRKGAVSAQAGQWGIIPGSMGTRSYVVQGKGSRESFCSCSHGAGRAMSRAQARRTFTANDLADQTAGVECRKDDGVVDEIPGAYKNIDQVMADQADLVDVRFTLKQVLCVKG